MLNSIEYTTWRRLVRPQGSPPNSVPDPVWVEKNRSIRSIPAEQAQQFAQLVQQQLPVRDRGLDSANR